MKYIKDNTKPEGFHAEFKSNARSILYIGAAIMIVVAIILKYVL